MQARRFLAEALGVSKADDFLRTYYEAHKWGLATTKNLRTIAEESCDCDQTELFESWVYPR